MRVRLYFPRGSRSASYPLDTSARHPSAHNHRYAQEDRAKRAGQSGLSIGHQIDRREFFQLFGESSPLVDNRDVIAVHPSTPFVRASFHRCFRRHGFNGTSTAQVVEELGVNRKSMYAEFGSRPELIESTLEHYNQNHLLRVLTPIESDRPGIEEIRWAFSGFAAASERWFSGRGCLMCNTAVERSALDLGSGHSVAEHSDRITRAFRHALEHSQRTGQIDASTDLDELAAFLTTVLIGVAACIRAEAPASQLHATSRIALNRLGEEVAGWMTVRAPWASRLSNASRPGTPAPSTATSIHHFNCSGVLVACGGLDARPVHTDMSDDEHLEPGTD